VTRKTTCLATHRRPLPLGHLGDVRIRSFRTLSLHGLLGRYMRLPRPVVELLAHTRYSEASRSRLADTRTDLPVTAPAALAPLSPFSPLPNTSGNALTTGAAIMGGCVYCVGHTARCLTTSPRAHRSYDRRKRPPRFYPLSHCANRYTTSYPCV